MSGESFISGKKHQISTHTPPGLLFEIRDGHHFPFPKMAAIDHGISL